MTEVVSPVGGTIKPLEQLSDPVFASLMVGDGVAVSPPHDGPVTVHAPVSGKAVRVMPHAFVILSEDGKGILVHVGIDTVGLKGEGFEVHAQQKDTVTVGQPMVTYDPAAVAAKGLEPAVIVVEMDSAAGSITHTHPAAEAPVAVGDPLFSTTNGTD